MHRVPEWKLYRSCHLKAYCCSANFAIFNIPLLSFLRLPSVPFLSFALSCSILSYHHLFYTLFRYLYYSAFSEQSARSTMSAIRPDLMRPASSPQTPASSTASLLNNPHGSASLTPTFMGQSNRRSASNRSVPSSIRYVCLFNIHPRPNHQQFLNQSMSRAIHPTANERYQCLHRRLQCTFRTRYVRIFIQVL